MKTIKPILKFSLIFCIGLLSICFFLAGCTSGALSTNESQITRVINNFFQAINDVNREKALSYTIPNSPAFDMTNKFFDTKIPLAEQNNIKYEYSFDIQNISILNDSANVELNYSFKYIGTNGLVSPNFNGDFTLLKVNNVWFLDSAPFAN